MQRARVLRDRRLNRLLVLYRDRGDTRALGELFDNLSPELLRVARHVTRDAAEAEDRVQATFLTALEHPERFDEARPFTASAVDILTNHAKAWRRSADGRRVETTLTFDAAWNRDTPPRAAGGAVRARPSGVHPDPGRVYFRSISILSAPMPPPSTRCSVASERL